ncbi:hypothetical protein DZC30_08910 [Comamonas testosteroni]|uniref:TonB C-terminal domain-containing protein n=1 Tax=Comamonas testosteroni TaxID=285 RepID=A0A373FPC1_COMTE|nr:energy transducer TonB [Comamonas testosteroni]RGE45382.1 hypothetical protein DZC30_08910 [Comamonas testosteroni]
MSFTARAESTSIRIPAAAALLALFWLGGCRQIPQLPPYDDPAYRTSTSVSADDAGSEPPRVLEQIQRPGPPAPPAAVQAPMPPVIPPSAPRQTVQPFVPLGASSASWIAPSQRPLWLQNCLALHQLDQPPKIERTVIPDFPSQLMIDGLQARVVLLLHISAQGKLLHHLVKPGAPPEAVKPAVAAVQQWKFSPITRNGQAADACFAQSFRYVF